MQNKVNEISSLSKTDFDELVKTEEEFSSTQKSGFTVYAYHMAFADTFESDDAHDKCVRLNSRGIVFSDNDELLRLPLDKFFNINEKEYTSIDELKNKKILWVHDKLDGTMIAPFMLNRKIIWGTKRVADGFSQDIEKTLTEMNCLDYYTSFVTSCITRGYTPIFEYHNPENPNTVIVLRYAEAFLRLTAVRNIHNGEYVNIHDAHSNDESFDTIVNNFEYKVQELSITTLEEIVHELADLQDVEGRVVMLEDHGFVKIKTPWYVVRHKIVELFENKHILAQIILDKNILKYDDLLSTLSDEDVKKLNEYSIYIKNIVNTFIKYIRSKALQYSEPQDYARSELSSEYTMFNKCVFSLINNKMDETALYSAVVDIISKQAYKQLRFANFVEKFEMMFDEAR